MPARIAAAEFPASVDPCPPGGIDPSLPGAALSPLDPLCARAAAEGADLILLPEAAAPGYRRARADRGPAARALALRLAAQHRLSVCLGFLDGDGCHLGLATPGGAWSSYRKRRPAPAEARHWRPGRHPGILRLPTRDGDLRAGLLICADLLHLDAWEDLRGRVDLVLIAAAWPDYASPPPPGLGWLWRGSNPYRDRLIARAAASLGAPVALANACGPGFSGGAGLWTGEGERIKSGAFCVADLSPIPPHAPRPLHHEGPWRAFLPLYAAAARLTARMPR